MASDPVLDQLTGMEIVKAVEKATDEGTDPDNVDWALFLQISDWVNSFPEGPKSVMDAVVARLKSKSSKVVFLSLILLDSLMKNCGGHFHALVARKEIMKLLESFLESSRINVKSHRLFKRLASGDDVFQSAVEEKVLALIQTWAKEFGSMSQLKVFSQTYDKWVSEGCLFPQTDDVPVITPKPHDIHEEDRSVTEAVTLLNELIDEKQRTGDLESIKEDDVASQAIEIIMKGVTVDGAAEVKERYTKACNGELELVRSNSPDLRQRFTKKESKLRLRASSHRDLLVDVSVKSEQPRPRDQSQPAEDDLKELGPQISVDIEAARKNKSSRPPAATSEDDPFGLIAEKEVVARSILDEFDPLS